MFLMSDELIKRYRERRAIEIEPYDARQLAATCYYFRLGGQAEMLHTSEDINVLRRGHLLIPSGKIARVVTLERFRIPENVLVLLGNQTKFPTEHHLLLMHGPTVDPGYNAPLDMALLNVGTADVRVNYGDEIGKAMFFDISDSALEEARLTQTAVDRQKRLLDLADTPDAEIHG